MNAARSYRLAGKRVWGRAFEHNERNILRALATHAPLGSLLDLGCDDGARTVRWAGAAGARVVHGVEVVAARARLSLERGISVTTADLGAPLPFDDRMFDAVVSNQVIEHLFDTDLFLAEAFRVLRPGGVVVTSTENLASWHNVVALLLGWQPFSLTNVSNVGSIGNPMGLLVGGDIEQTMPGAATWQHHRVFAKRGLVALHRAHGFVAVDCRGAGYYPLPRRLGSVNPAHAAFITVVGRRELSARAASRVPEAD
jgi:SAM-dependent methyltransferase